MLFVWGIYHIATLIYVSYDCFHSLVSLIHIIAIFIHHSDFLFSFFSYLHPSIFYLISVSIYSLFSILFPACAVPSYSVISTSFLYFIAIFALSESFQNMKSKLRIIMQTMDCMRRPRRMTLLHDTRTSPDALSTHTRLCSTIGMAPPPPPPPSVFVFSYLFASLIFYLF